MDRRSLLLLLTLAALWGSSYLFIKIALDDLSPAGVVFARTALGALVVLPVALRRDALRGIRPLLGLGVVLAVIQVAAPFLLISYGERHISSGLAGILVASAPIFTALLAPFVDTEERSTGTALLGIGVGIVGVALILGVDLGGGGAALAGGLMVVGAAVGYAVGGFLFKRSFSSLDAIGVVTMTLSLSALLTLPLAAATAPDDLPSAGTVGALLALGVGGTGIAFVIYYVLISGLGPARALLVTYIAPCFAVFYGVTLRGEPLTVLTVVGLILIVGGSWLAGRGRRPAAAAAADVAVPHAGR